MAEQILMVTEAKLGELHDGCDVLSSHQFFVDESLFCSFDSLIRIEFKTRGRCAHILSHTDYVIVATDDPGVLDGVALVTELGCKALIEYVIVRPSSRKQGVARKMLASTIDLAARNGCRWVILNCSPELEDFYVKCGFGRVA